MTVPITKPTVGSDNDTWGTELNAALDALNAGVLGVAKTSDQSVTSSTVLVNDTALTVPVAASATYLVEWSLVTDGNASGDLKYAFTGPAGATMTWESEGLLTTDTTNVARAATDVAAIGTTVSHGTIASGTNSRVDGRGVLTVAGTAGNLQMQWAQATSNGTASKVKAGSYLKVTRIA